MKMLRWLERASTAVLFGMGASAIGAQSTHRAHLMVQTGHSQYISTAAYSMDGRYILTGSGDHLTILWDAVSGREIRIFRGHTDTVNSVAISSDDNYVLTGSSDHTARLWDAKAGKEMRRFGRHGDDVLSVALSLDGRTVAIAGRNKVSMWGAQSGDLLWQETSNDEFHAVAISPNGKFVLVGGLGGARLWESASGRELRCFDCHQRDIACAAFSADSRFVLTGGENGRAVIWDVGSGAQLHVLIGLTAEVASVAFSLDGRYALTATGGGKIRIWNTRTGREIRRFDVTPIGSVVPMIRSVVFSPDSKCVLAVSDFDKVQLLDAMTGRVVRRFMGSASSVDFAEISSDGDYLLTSSKEGITQLWDWRSGQGLQQFEGYVDGPWSVGRRAEGGYTISNLRAKPEAVLNYVEGPKPYSEPPNPRSVSRDPTRAVSSLPALAPLAGHYDDQSKDGLYAVVADQQGIVSVQETATGTTVQKFKETPAYTESVAISHDDRWVVSSSDRTIRLWDRASGNEVRQYPGHDDGVRCLAFSPNDMNLISASEDHTTRIWDRESGKELVSLISFANGGWAVVDPEGRFDTSDLDGEVPMQWVVDDDPLRALPLEIFMRDYYTPRLLSRIMNHETLPAIRPIAEIKNRVQPDVSVVSVTASKTHPGRVDVVVHAASRAEEKKDEKGAVLRDTQGNALLQFSGLQDLRLFRNGHLVANTPLNNPLLDGNFAFKDIQLPTSEKRVTFTAYAFNSERVKSATVAKEYAFEPGPTRKLRVWLVQVGVNRYEAAGCELHGAVNDAEELSRVLSQRLRDRGIDVQLPALLVSDGTREGATKEGIRTALANIAVKATPDDVFFLSFSGHGYGDSSGQFYLFPANIQGSCRDVNSVLLKNAISADELAEWLRPIDAGEMTFVLDSCQSASSVEANDFKPGPMGSRGLGQLAYDKRMRILAASQGNQAAQESNLLVGEAGFGPDEARTRGLLSYALTEEGLVEGKADWRPVDKKITVGEWLGYAADAVPKWLESGGVKSGRGFRHFVGKPGTVGAAQIPAVFDFTKSDGFVL